MAQTGCRFKGVLAQEEGKGNLFQAQDRTGG
jgi:hypothetical protein